MQEQPGQGSRRAGEHRAAVCRRWPAGAGGAVSKVAGGGGGVCRSAVRQLQMADGVGSQRHRALDAKWPSGHCPDYGSRWEIQYPRDWARVPCQIVDAASAQMARAPWTLRVDADLRTSA